MENRQQQILSEIREMAASIREQLEMLEAKTAELQQMFGTEGLAEEPIDIEIEEIVPVEEPAVEEIPEEVVEEPAADDLPEEIPEEVVEEPVADDLPEDIFGEPEPAVETPVEVVEEVPEETVTVADVAEMTAKPTINDSLADNCAWRRDIPGAQVRDIRSAISLNDRVIFINLLFNEDAQTFVNTLSQINTMDTLDQAVEYITTQFPEWDMNSELVYRFMMAVRRKVN